MRKILLFVCCLCLSFFCFTPFVNCCFPELENGGWCVLVGLEDYPEAGPVYVAARVAPVRDGSEAPPVPEIFPGLLEAARGMTGRVGQGCCIQGLQIVVTEGMNVEQEFRDRWRRKYEFPVRYFQEAKDAGEYVCWLLTPYAFYEVHPCGCLDNPPDGIGCSYMGSTLCLRFKRLEGGNSFEVKTLRGAPVQADNCAECGILRPCIPVPEPDPSILRANYTRIPEASYRWRYVSWDSLEPRIRNILQGQVRRIMGGYFPLAFQSGFSGEIPDMRLENRDLSRLIGQTPTY